MAEEKWTVFFGQRDAGNIRPLVGWKAGELRVAKIGAGTELKKNKPAVLAESGVFKTAEVQQCYFVTVEAESAEEACLVVDRVLSQGLSVFGTGTTTETFGGGGPSIKPFVNDAGKAVAALSANLEEVAVK